MTGRLYIFSLSNWSIEEALKGPDMENNAHVAEDEIDAFFYGKYVHYLRSAIMRIDADSFVAALLDFSIIAAFRMS